MQNRYINPDSDGKFYELHEMARTNCQDCKGCSACCRDMGDSIRLDPFDIWQMTRGLHETFGQLMESGKIAMTAENGFLIPYLRMSPGRLACPFLNEEGRCSIHSFRPGICRLFPMGRDFSQDRLVYICLDKLCPAVKSKIKVEKWIGIAESRQYHEYIQQWHTFRRNMQKMLAEAEAEEARKLNLYIIGQFYGCEYFEQEKFFPSFYKKVQTIYRAFGMDEIVIPDEK